ncbi:MAG: hypothetical protein ABSG65_36980 [Bryobacteraceae bacterium]
MSRDEIQKLLGGYASDTLSEAERRVLFEAALEDQELFDGLAKEQALRDVLQDSSARRQLLAALGPARVPFWWLRKPAVLAMASGLALLIFATLLVRQTRHAPHREAMVADAITPEPPVTIPPPAPTPRKAAESRAVGRNPTRLAPSPIARSAPAPAPSPPFVPSAHAAQAVGGLAGTPPAPPQMVQAPAGRNFVTQEASPLPALARAKAGSAGAASVAVDYTLLLREVDGQYQPVPSGTTFHVGDSVRVQAQPRSAGYISLFQRDATSAGWKLVASQRVEQGQRCELPSTGGLQSRVPAKLELLLVLSRVDGVDVDAQGTPTIVIEYR